MELELVLRPGQRVVAGHVEAPDQLGNAPLALVARRRAQCKSAAGAATYCASKTSDIVAAAARARDTFEQAPESGTGTAARGNRLTLALDS